MRPLYFIEHRGKTVRGQWFLECDRDTNSRAGVIDLIRSGEVDPVKVLEVIEDEGFCRDITDELFEEVRAGFRETALGSDICLERSKARMQLAAFDHAREMRKEKCERAFEPFPGNGAYL
jgi:hypothetical protein